MYLIFIILDRSSSIYRIKRIWNTDYINTKKWHFELNGCLTDKITFLNKIIPRCVQTFKLIQQWEQSKEL